MSRRKKLKGHRQEIAHEIAELLEVIIVMYDFSEGRAQAKTSKGWLHVNEKYEPVYEERYTFVGIYINGEAWVSDGDDHYKIDLHGKRIPEEPTITHIRGLS